MNNKLRIVFFGTPDFVVPVLDSLCQNFDVVGVVTAPDQKVGRKQILTPSPVKQYALKNNVLVINPDILENLDVDLFVVAAYGKIIPQNILDIPKYGAINIHPSLLPKYRGPSPIQSAILEREGVTGISIIKMDEKMDHGPIVYAEEFSITDLDNFQTLSTKMFERSASILPKIIPAFVAGNIKLTEQNDSDATYCKIIKKEDGYFEIPKKIDRMIRAYYPWPTAWTRWNGKIIKFLPDGLIQMEGKKPVKLEEFLRGYPKFPIKKLLEDSRSTG